MGLKRYYIDGSDVPLDDIPAVMDFIENRSFCHAMDTNRRCSYIAFWEEHINPSSYPELSQCKIHSLP